jgi:hypothetical protein
VLDEIESGIVVLDKNFQAHFINHAFNQMWGLPKLTDGSTYNFADIVEHGRRTGLYITVPGSVQDYVRQRKGRHRLSDGRMLNYRASTRRRPASVRQMEWLSCMATHPRAAAYSIASVVAPSSSSNLRHLSGRPPVELNNACTNCTARDSVSLSMAGSLAAGWPRFQATAARQSAGDRSDGSWAYRPVFPSVTKWPRGAELLNIPIL